MEADAAVQMARVTQAKERASEASLALAATLPLDLALISATPPRILMPALETRTRPRRRRGRCRAKAAAEAAKMAAAFGSFGVTFQQSVDASAEGGEQSDAAKDQDARDWRATSAYAWGRRRGHSAGCAGSECPAATRIRQRPAAACRDLPAQPNRRRRHARLHSRLQGNSVRPRGRPRGKGALHRERSARSGRLRRRPSRRLPRRRWRQGGRQAACPRGNGRNRRAKRTFHRPAACRHASRQANRSSHSRHPARRLREAPTRCGEQRS